jgi:hypothetical protein
VDSCILDLDVNLLPPLGEMNAAPAACLFHHQKSNKVVEWGVCKLSFFIVK